MITDKLSLSVSLFFHVSSLFFFFLLKLWSKRFGFTSEVAECFASPSIQTKVYTESC